MPYSSGRQVPLCRLAEFALWGVVVVLLVAGAAIGVMVGMRWFPAVICSVGFGLALSAAAAAVTICNRITRQEAQMRDVFLMGRESTTVRPLERNRPTR